MPCTFCNYSGHYGHTYGSCDREALEDLARGVNKIARRKSHSKEFKALKKQAEIIKKEMSSLKKKLNKVTDKLDLLYGWTGD